MSIRCGNCGRLHDSVADVRQCHTDGPAHKVEQNPIQGEPHEFKPDWDMSPPPEDPWEGATEGDPGDWSPGPASYLDARRQNSESFAISNATVQGGFGGPTQDEIVAKQWDDRLKGIEEGFYALSEDEIYMVVRSRQGRLYAKVNSGDGRWDYAAGAITKLEPKMRMDLDAAKKYGQETGQCLVCGRALTNPDSIEAGIGPVCASRF